MTDNRLSSVFKPYEDGKHRRYNLLFAVNGGAFAIAKLLATCNVPSPLSLCECFLPWVSPSAEQTVPAGVLGNLSLCQLSLGMVLFTIVMTLDIFMFGENMREKAEEGKKVFGWQGKLVLIIIGWLICAGWLLVSFKLGVFVMVSVGYFILFIILIVTFLVGTVAKLRS